MLYRPWQIARPDAGESAALAAKLGMPQLVCDVLLARGKTETEAAAMLGAGDPLPDPMLLPGMERAVARILAAVDGGQRIVIFGDYDVDGVTATALLYLYLDSLGADVYYKLPNRADEGYGLFSDTVEMLAKKHVNLIITVDNGVSAHEAIARAGELGVDVVVTDHHLPPDTLPAACAVVDPQLAPDAIGAPMCGAGVAFLLAAALEGCAPEELAPHYGDLAAIGTIADMMPLTGANRTLVREGLYQLRNTDRPGLAALIELCGLAGKEITAENVAFGLAPRLNAAGRMDSATTALELLLCEEPDEAAQRAEALNEQNVARGQTEQEITRSVLDMIAADASYQSDRILVVAGEGYHQGVIGIVASRVTEHFGKPAIIISIDENGEGKGSGRSIAGVSLYDAIAACEPLLLRFGGHALAAGLSVQRENISALRREINAWAQREHPVMQRPALMLDALLPTNVTVPDIEALDFLAPFGNGNPSPLFLLENAVVDGVYAVSEGKHSRLRLRCGKHTLYAVLFRQSPDSLPYPAGSVIDAAVAASVYDGKNGVSVSLRIKELRPAGLRDIYLESYGLYEAFRGGTVLTAQQRAAILPTRADTVQVYRTVQKRLNADDLRPLFHALGEENAGKICVSLQALTELGIIALHEDENGARWYAAVPDAPKSDLASAPVLRELEGSEQA